MVWGGRGGREISFLWIKLSVSQQKRFPCCLTRGAVQLTFASVPEHCWPQPVSAEPPRTVSPLLLQEQGHWGSWWQLHPSLWSTTQTSLAVHTFLIAFFLFLCTQITNALWVRRLSRDAARFEREGMRLRCPFPASKSLYCLLLNLLKELGSLTILVQPQQIQELHRL